MKDFKQEKGFILLLTMLIISIILAVSFGIYAISIKEVVLASFLRDSALAFGAADRASECALYWDRSSPANGMPYTIFATSTAYGNIPAVTLNNAKCEGVQLDSAATTGWTVQKGAASGTTTYSIIFSDKTCADVAVYKVGEFTTTILSSGYNLCSGSPPVHTGSRVTNREIEITSNF